MTRKTALFSVLLLLAFNADAAEPWDWHVTPYLWAAGIDGSASVANVSADLSADFEDIVNVLQGGVLLRVEAKSGSNGLFGDLVFLALEEEDARDTTGGTLEADLDSLIVEGGYRRYTGDAFAIDIGVRYWDFETELTPAVIPAASSSRDWVDGFIGAHFESDLGEHWDWVLRGNVGAGGSDLALGFEADLRREFANGNRMTVGFRYLDISYEDSSGAAPTDLDLAFAGLTVGYSFDL